MGRINDLPVTSAELDAFYGASPSFIERQMAIGEAASNFDNDPGEFADAVDCGHKQIMSLIDSNDATALGEYVMYLRRQRIAQLASQKLYGRAGVINASEVTQ